MILRDLFIGLDRSHYAIKEAYAFKLRTRCLCHFIGRHVWEKQIRIPGFNRIVIEHAKDADPKLYVNHCQVACISMPLKQTDFAQLGEEAAQEFYIDCITTAIDRLLTEFPEAVAAIHEPITLFRKGSYKNEWLYKSRRLSALGLGAKLTCRMTMERFALRLSVTRAQKLLYDQDVFSSDPDENVFHPRFKDVVAKDGKVMVTARVSKPLITLTLAEIEANQAPPPASQSVW